MSEAAVVRGDSTGGEWRSGAHGGGRLAPVWKKGQTGNPQGKSGAYLECVKICREASPQAARKLVELMSDSDSRVALMAARECMDRGIGKVKEVVPEEPRTLNLDALSDDDQRTLLGMLRALMGR